MQVPLLTCRDRTLKRSSTRSSCFAQALHAAEAWLISEQESGSRGWPAPDRGRKGTVRIRSCHRHVVTANCWLKASAESSNGDASTRDRRDGSCSTCITCSQPITWNWQSRRPKALSTALLYIMWLLKPTFLRADRGRISDPSSDRIDPKARGARRLKQKCGPPFIKHTCAWCHFRWLHV